MTLIKGRSANSSIENFEDLANVPQDLTGQAGKVVKVNPGETGLIFADEAGGGGTPGDTVVAETNFGQSPTAGSEAAYSRKDHTHGTPDTPTPVLPGGAGGTTVAATGEICVDTTSGTLNFYDGAAERVLTPIMSKAITIEDPEAAEDLSLFFTEAAITITKIVGVILGAQGSVTMTIRHGTDRDAAGAEVVTGGTAITNTTTGDVITAFDDATVVAASFLWLETTAEAAVDQLNVTIFYRQDA